MTSETSIPIDKVTRDRLKTYGVKGETYRDILTRLMDSYDARELETNTRGRIDKFVVEERSGNTISTRVVFSEPILLKEDDVLEIETDIETGKLISATKTEKEVKN